MPKKRKKTGTRKLEKRLFIICEGEKNKSESAYFRALIKKCKFKGEKIKVSVKDTKKNTGKELVKEAKKIKEYDIDEAWVVYDRDGYTQHTDTFSSAKNSDIRIAFSSICFEYWILLHFEYTSKPFEKCDDLIKYMKDKDFIDYRKSSQEIFILLIDKLVDACENAIMLQEHQKRSNSQGTPIYEYNPYTNVNELVKRIFELQDIN